VIKISDASTGREIAAVADPMVSVVAVHKVDRAGVAVWVQQPCPGLALIEG
jgi:hypothetical protein